MSDRQLVLRILITKTRITLKKWINSHCGQRHPWIRLRTEFVRSHLCSEHFQLFHFFIEKTITRTYKFMDLSVNDHQTYDRESDERKAWKLESWRTLETLSLWCRCRALLVHLDEFHSDCFNLQFKYMNLLYSHHIYKFVYLEEQCFAFLKRLSDILKRDELSIFDRKD